MKPDKCSNSFWDIVGVDQRINPVEAPTLEKAVIKTYKDPAYYYYQSSWFIDIKQGFRIFNYRDSNYIAKKTTPEKALLEHKKAKEARTRLADFNIGGRHVEVVVPKLFESAKHKKSCYVVSSYLGLDLNNASYKDTLVDLSLESCLQIVKQFLEKGVAYRGFLPRNIVLRDKFIYLFDWEDAKFSNKKSGDLFDHLWQTNFLLNWGYLYGFKELKQGLQSALGITYPLKQPPLVDYEKMFACITGEKSSPLDLRRNIDKVVFGAEGPLRIRSKSFYLHPNDMGHLIADIYTDEIDVLNDLLSFNMRRVDENKYLLNSILATRLFASYFRSKLVLSTESTKSIGYYGLVHILLMIEDCLTVKSYSNILNQNVVPTNVF
jgi:hypothetical protein